MELLTIEDVMRMLGIGRVTAKHYLDRKDCPTLPRVKGGKYLVPKDAFLRWLENR